MVSGSQYGEDIVIKKFFNSKRDGYVVEVGAADGIENSHTHFLCFQYNWSGILIEPHPQYFYNLEEAYGYNENLVLINKGILNKFGSYKFYLNGQISRFLTDPEVIKKFNHHGVKDIECVTLESIFEDYNVPIGFDFLTVDAEGSDMDVLESANLLKWKPKLVCVEHSMPIDILNEFMKQRNYKHYKKTTGNTFYEYKAPTSR